MQRVREARIMAFSPVQTGLLAMWSEGTTARHCHNAVVARCQCVQERTASPARRDTRRTAFPSSTHLPCQQGGLHAQPARPPDRLTALSRRHHFRLNHRLDEPHELGPMLALVITQRLASRHQYTSHRPRS